MFGYETPAGKKSENANNGMSAKKESP